MIVISINILKYTFLFSINNWITNIDMSANINELILIFYKLFILQTTNI